MQVAQELMLLANRVPSAWSSWRSEIDIGLISICGWPKGCDENQVFTGPVAAEPHKGHAIAITGAFRRERGIQMEA
jgi:hypothetical protein